MGVCSFHIRTPDFRSFVFFRRLGFPFSRSESTLATRSTVLSSGKICKRYIDKTHLDKVLDGYLERGLDRSEDTHVSVKVSPIKRMVTVISKKRKLVADGVFYAELNEFFTRELAEEGYSGVEVRVTPTTTEVIIRATRTQDVLGENGRRINELTLLVQKRFKYQPGTIVLFAERVQERGLSAVAQAESLKFKLLNGLAIRRAAYGVVRYVMESGAKGCEVVISGKLRAARAKSMKFSDGFLIHSGQPVNDFIDTATRHVLLRQGVLGIKVKIMKDPSKARTGPTALPDAVEIIEPKDEDVVKEPSVKDYRPKKDLQVSSIPEEVSEAA
ncbi:40S ribosomal uS3 domain-containing protein Ecym_6420 [Eremothecium cymbalariae DBVPG|uniref:Small ribosomal subunit protein uS3 n=1 Tax=Eremothecium cymbalariae (strain CBS 270.75 / DBVPG 7215 / KCTC 17166 / NRRL Y-17582) TaxID=931890 RepID=G8JUL2_ERECY|nr:hypothetical protein Ecym_6420 [Eremothecium cymbalariae DBVPG\